MLFRQLQPSDCECEYYASVGPYKLASGQIIYFHLKNKYSKHLERERWRGRKKMIKTGITNIAAAACNLYDSGLKILLQSWACG